MKFPLVCLAAHDWKLRRWVDFRKCQTSTATPAEPGGLPVMLATRIVETLARQINAVITKERLDTGYRVTVTDLP
jgi:hypothetical protein